MTGSRNGRDECGRSGTVTADVHDNQSKSGYPGTRSVIESQEGG